MTKYVYHYCAEHRTAEGFQRFTGIITVDNRINSGNYDALKTNILNGDDSISIGKLEIISLTPQHTVEE